MVIEPVVTVFAIAEPEIEPSPAEANTAALAGPPRYLPAIENAKSIKNLPAPVTSKNAPNKTKINTVVAAIPKAEPNTPLAEKI